MSHAATPHRSRVPWALAVTVGLCSGLAGYVIHAARVNRIPKQYVEVRRLTEMTGSAESPAISPDSNAVAFVALSGGRRQIWVISTWFDVRAAKIVTKDDAEHFGPRWSSDSSKLIYFALGAVWEIPARGGEARKLVDAIGPGDFGHDGKNLAYFRIRDGATELAVGDRSIVKLPADHRYANLRWSPDDKKIAYLEDAKIMVVSASGGDPVEAAAQGFTVQGFTWAPDNSGLIESSGGPPVFNLRFFPRVEGRTPSQLTFGELSYESPDISPRGTLVVSRKGLATGADADIVMFTGLKW